MAAHAFTIPFWIILMFADSWILYESNLFSGFSPTWCLYHALLVHSWPPSHSSDCSSWMWFQSCLDVVPFLLVLVILEVLASTPCLLCSYKPRWWRQCGGILLSRQPWHTEHCASSWEWMTSALDVGFLGAHFPTTSPRSKGFLCKVVIIANCSAVMIIP